VRKPLASRLRSVTRESLDVTGSPPLLPLLLPLLLFFICAERLPLRDTPELSLVLLLLLLLPLPLPLPLPLLALALGVANSEGSVLLIGWKFCCVLDAERLRGAASGKGSDAVDISAVTADVADVAVPNTSSVGIAVAVAVAEHQAGRGAPLRSEYYDLVDAAGIAPSQSGNSNCFAL
jgi:hypothetical protein